MLENHWKGKLWYAYGTSMTSIAQGKFVPVVEKLSGLTVVNKGIPGGLPYAGRLRKRQCESGGA